MLPSPIHTVPLPLPALPINIRPGVMRDLAFIDALQKKQTRQVGWMPTGQLEGKIKAGHVLIAEESLVMGHSSSVDASNNDQ